MNNTLFVFILIVIYLIAAIPSGVVLARLMGSEDVRQKGSGNIGATNVYRVAGKLAGILTLFGDTMKSFLPLLAVKSLAGANTDTAWHCLHRCDFGALFPGLSQIQRRQGRGDSSGHFPGAFTQSSLIGPDYLYPERSTNQIHLSRFCIGGSFCSPVDSAPGSSTADFSGHALYRHTGHLAPPQTISSACSMARRLVSKPDAIPVILTFPEKTPTMLRHQITGFYWSTLA